MDRNEKRFVVRVFVMKIKNRNIYNFELFLGEGENLLFSLIFFMLYIFKYLGNVMKEILYIWLYYRNEVLDENVYNLLI